MKDIQKTYSMKEAEIQKKWYVVDAEGKVLGRLATQIATILRGKHKPEYTPNQDMGDNIIVINADKIILTGMKSTDKDYFKHTQYPGGERFTNIKKIMKEQPEFVIMHAVKGMLPKSRLARVQMTNLKIYAGNKHPHEAQLPEIINL